MCSRWLKNYNKFLKNFDFYKTLDIVTEIRRRIQWFGQEREWSKVESLENSLKKTLVTLAQELNWEIKYKTTWGDWELQTEKEIN